MMFFLEEVVRASHSGLYGLSVALRCQPNLLRKVIGSREVALALDEYAPDNEHGIVWRRNLCCPLRHGSFPAGATDKEVAGLGSCGGFADVGKIRVVRRISELHAVVAPGEWEHFAEWKKINDEGEEGRVSLETVTVQNLGETGNLSQLADLEGRPHPRNLAHSCTPDCARAWKERSFRLIHSQRADGAPSVCRQVSLFCKAKAQNLAIRRKVPIWGASSDQLQTNRCIAEQGSGGVPCGEIG